ncbi:unspecific monooxygenase [Cooperia oncophora]
MKPFRLWKEKHGRCFTFWMADRPAIVIADYELMKETLVKDGAAYTGRQDVPLSKMEEITEWLKQVVSYGNSTRRFALHVFRNFGMGKDVMQERVLDEVKDFLRKCQQNPGEPLDLRDYIDSAVGSIINSLLFGFRFDESNMDLFNHLKAVIVRIMKMSARPSFLLFMLFPGLKRLPFFKAYSKEVREKQATFCLICSSSKIEIHKKEIDFDSVESTDYVEAYLKEQKSRENEPNHGGFSRSTAHIVFRLLWMAGYGNAFRLSLRGTVVYLLNEVQKHDTPERNGLLISLVLEDVLITNADRASLPYMNAVINIEGYRIPAGTLVLPQISTIIRTTSIRVDIYLRTELLYELTKWFHFQWEKDNVWVKALHEWSCSCFLANFFNKFEVTTYGNQRPSTVKKFGATVRAQDFSVVLKERH